MDNMNGIFKIKLVFCLTLLLAVVGFAQQAEPAATAASVLQAAEDAFAQANAISSSDQNKAVELYKVAIDNYLRLGSEFGISNEHIYYNIGNAWLLQGDVGRAIVNYRRAVSLNPGNTDIAGNLNYARSLRLDQIPVPVEEKVLAMLFFWHYDFSIKSRFIVGIACWSLSCVFIAVMLLTRKKNSPALAICGILLLGTLLMAGSVGWESLGSQNNYGVIVAREVIARQGDGDNYPESFTDALHSGTECRVLKHRQGWYQIELGDGAITWVKEANLEVV